MIRHDADDLISYLDSLAKLDPVAMGALVSFKFPCSRAMAQHPTVQALSVGEREAGALVGMLGILNGYAGVYDEGKLKGWGAISAIVDCNGHCVGFRRTDSV